MLFNSLEFIFVFLPISILIYFSLLALKKRTLAKFFLAFASIFFYSWWNINYLPVIIISIVFNYWLGLVLNRKNFDSRISKKNLLSIGIVSNILALGYFKYSDFVILNINYFFNKPFELQNLILPLAISFFTFQQIAYLIDSFNNKTAHYSFTNYILFVTFFPQLIAGPIVHHSEMMPQFKSKANLKLRSQNVAKGIFIFAIGLYKKVVIADTFAIWATKGFDEATVLTFFDAWGTSLSYTFQLYFDFSGYTDMAIGCALLFNILLPINFNSPYKAVNIQDFWRRWHITLSRFLRDYIYIPLGGNRNGNFKTIRNLLLTFLIGGLWHGAGWTFLFWGFLHGSALVFFNFWKLLNIKVPKFLGWFVTFNFVNIAWVFFRANNFEKAIFIIKEMFNISSAKFSLEFASFINLIIAHPLLIIKGSEVASLFTSIETIKYLLIFGLIAFTFPNTMQLINLIPYNGKWAFKPSFKFAFIFAILTYLALLQFVGNTVHSEFLYFNF